MLRKILLTCLSLSVSILAVMVMAFGITQLIPGDPLDLKIDASKAGNADIRKLNRLLYEREYRARGFDRPAFFLSWSSLAVPDSFSALPFPEERKQLCALSAETGRPQGVYQWSKKLRTLSLAEDEDSVTLATVNMGICLRDVRSACTCKEAIERLSAVIDTSAATTPHLEELKTLRTQLTHISSHAVAWKKYVPVFRFSADNRFVRWLSEVNIFKGDWGISTRTGRNVREQLESPFWITIAMALLALLFSVGLAIPTALAFAASPRAKFVASLEHLFMFVYAIPLFCIATGSLFLLANPYMLQIFPSSGIGPIGGFSPFASTFERTIGAIPYLILPVSALAFPCYLYFTTLLHATLRAELTQEYALTALAKGLSLHEILRRHVLKNAAGPLFSAAVTTFPVLAGGSLMVETIFSIPGLGMQIVMAVRNQDYPILIAVFMMTGIATLIFFKLGDVLQERLRVRSTPSVRQGGLNG